MFVSEDERIFEIIEEFINECRNNFNDDVKIDWLRSVGKEKFLKEYCTLKLIFPRQKGSSTLALKLFDKYDANLCNIMERYCQTQKDRIKTGVRSFDDGRLIYEFKNKEKVKDVININSQKFTNDFKEVIIIDHYTYTKGDSLERFYKAISESSTVKCIICFG